MIIKLYYRCFQFSFQWATKTCRKSPLWEAMDFLDQVNQKQKQCFSLLGRFCRFCQFYRYEVRNLEFDKKAFIYRIVFIIKCDLSTERTLRREIYIREILTMKLFRFYISSQGLPIKRWYLRPQWTFFKPWRWSDSFWKANFYILQEESYGSYVKWAINTIRTQARFVKKGTKKLC